MTTKKIQDLDWWGSLLFAAGFIAAIADICVITGLFWFAWVMVLIYRDVRSSRGEWKWK